MKHEHILEKENKTWRADAPYRKVLVGVLTLVIGLVPRL